MSLEIEVKDVHKPEVYDNERAHRNRWLLTEDSPLSK